MWNNQVSEDLAMLNIGFAPVMETVDYHWEIFVWGESMIKVTGDLDLGVPNTWFEYECECNTLTHTYVRGWRSCWNRGSDEHS